MRISCCCIYLVHMYCLTSIPWQCAYFTISRYVPTLNRYAQVSVQCCTVYLYLYIWAICVLAYF